MTTTTEKTAITVNALVNAPVQKVWKFWTDPKHIVKWNNASDDWHTPSAENDLRVDGKFLSRMEARDESVGFEFTGIYTRVEPQKLIEYVMDDGRKVTIKFDEMDNKTTVTETFDAEQTNSIEMQQTGWQAILNNFKEYVEKSTEMEKISFNIKINASPEKVYKTLLDDKTYREWTAPFNPTSHYKGTWEKGSKILFIGSDDKGNVGGMVSRIEENIPNKFVSIKHLGILEGDKEITSGPQVEGWGDAMENYTLTEENGKTLFSVETDANNEYKDYFEETWPKALDKLKEISER
ncbi:MAG: SRPBCC domain-containing protein [Nitrosopumilus sp.]|nr:SRPBCC domain-containing protein [Nitrosopumilus sp.]